MCCNDVGVSPSYGFPDSLTLAQNSKTVSDAQSQLPAGQVEHGLETVPSYKGVKFQDGLSPGQGDDGETIIPGVDRHNASGLHKRPLQPVLQQESKHRNLIERTTWTFIMIAGFIGSFVGGHINSFTNRVVSSDEQSCCVWAIHI